VVDFQLIVAIPQLFAKRAAIPEILGIVVV
jgi:hypothetical protein